MITKDQALTAQEFHYGECVRTVGPRGGVKVKQVSYRRNGKTETWKTRQDDFRIPVKYGLKSCGQIHPGNAHHFHTAEDCPLNPS
jgi:hypothetical protein